MGLVIQSGKLTREELAQILEKYSDKFSFLIASDWREIHFDRFDPGHQAISNSDRGRAFGDNAELRWRLDEEGVKLICRWIADDDNGQLQGEAWTPFPELCDLKDQEENEYLLWGLPLQIPGDDKLFWYQARIPKKLLYPANDVVTEKCREAGNKTPLVLQVREYKKDGRTIFERFIKLDEYKSSSTKGSEGKP